jgi:CRP/FNR family cyclic AMP-dependent transcriptional regulator
MNVVVALQRCALFRDFSETGLKIFASIAAEKKYPTGTPLFVENMVGDSLFVVKSGTVRITQKTPNGERDLWILGPGDALGAASLLGKSVRFVSAIAATDCEVVEITQRDFLRLQPQKPQACLKLAIAIGADLAARVAESRELLRDVAGRKPS